MNDLGTKGVRPEQTFTVQFVRSAQPVVIPGTRATLRERFGEGGKLEKIRADGSPVWVRVIEFGFDSGEGGWTDGVG